VCQSHSDCPNCPMCCVVPPADRRSGACSMYGTFTGTATSGDLFTCCEDATTSAPTGAPTEKATSTTTSAPTGAPTEKKAALPSVTQDFKFADITAADWKTPKIKESYELGYAKTLNLASCGETPDPAPTTATPTPAPTYPIKRRGPATGCNFKKGVLVTSTAARRGTTVTFTTTFDVSQDASLKVLSQSDVESKVTPVTLAKGIADVIEQTPSLTVANTKFSNAASISSTITSPPTSAPTPVYVAGAASFGPSIIVALCAAVLASHL